MEIDRQTWTAVLKLALAVSVVAALAAIVISSAGNIPQAAIVLPVIVVAFTVSWIQTGRAHRSNIPARVSVHRDHSAAPTA